MGWGQKSKPYNLRLRIQGPNYLSLLPKVIMGPEAFGSGPSIGVHR